MNRFEKGDHKIKLVRVPAALKRKIEEVIFNSRTVLAGCPFGHDIRLTIKLEYVPKGGPDLRLDVEIRRKKVSPGPRLVQSDEPVTNEYFEALLGSPLREREKRFVRFFQKRKNEPTSAWRWMQEGFNGRSYMREINSLSRHHRLGVSFGETGEYDVQEGLSAARLMKYKFYVMEPATKARE